MNNKPRRAGIKKTTIVILGFGIISLGLLPGCGGNIRVTKAGQDVSFISGGGGNTVVIDDPDSNRIFIVDTKMMGAAKKLRDYVYSEAPGAQIYIINTHIHPDHTGGNKLYKTAEIIAPDYTAEQWKKETGGEIDMPVSKGAALAVVIAGDKMIITNRGNGHTLKDMAVYLVKRRMLITGDLIFHNAHPVMMKKNGTDIKGWINILKGLKDEFPDTETVIPGHGPPGGPGLIDEQLEYLQDVLEAKTDGKKAEQLGRKYKDYSRIPFMSGWDKSINYGKK